MKYFLILWTLMLLVVKNVASDIFNGHFERCVDKALWSTVKYNNNDVVSIKRNNFGAFDSCVALIPDSNLSSGSVLELIVYSQLHFENSGLEVLMYTEDYMVPFSYIHKGSSVINRDQLASKWTTVSFPVRNNTRKIEVHGFCESNEIILIDSLQFISHEVSHNDDRSTIMKLITFLAYNNNESPKFQYNVDNNNNAIIDSSMSNSNSEIRDRNKSRRSIPNINDNDSDNTSETSEKSAESTDDSNSIENTTEPTTDDDTDQETTQRPGILENADLTILIIVFSIVGAVIVLAALGSLAFCIGKRKAVERRPLEEDFDQEREPPATVTIPRVKGIYYNPGSITPSRYSQ